MRPAAVDEASRTLRHIRSIYVENIRATVENGRIGTYQVNAKVSFELDDDRKRRQ
jgi:flavin-binding protein dodecin